LSVLSDPVLNLTDGSYWRQIYQQLHRANPASPRGYYPIPPITIPILLSNYIVAVAAESQLARSNWWLGCRLQMVIDVPGSAFGNVEAHQVNVPLNRGVLVSLPHLAPQYKLRADVPSWHQELSLTIYEYMGPSGDSTETLIQNQSDLIRVDLVRIERKIDYLA
jgi:hypothetical protein